jgi:hypothetical protein
MYICMYVCNSTACNWQIAVPVQFERSRTRLCYSVSVQSNSHKLHVNRQLACSFLQLCQLHQNCNLAVDLQSLSHNHQPTTFHCWTYASPMSRHLARSSATRIQLLPAVLRKSLLHLAWGRTTLDAVSTPELVYPSGYRFYGWYGQSTATSAHHYGVLCRWL